MLILPDQRGLYDRDPRQDPDAKLLAEGRAGDPQLLSMAGGSGVLGRGGMRSKLQAAEKAARSGASTVIASGREANVITRVLDGEAIGTHLYAAQGRVAARKQWLAGQARAAGKLRLDAGAVLIMEVDGYTDSVGGDDYNQQLSEKRATAVRDYLAAQGVPDAAITAKGFGKTNPVASNDTPQGRQQNRRVELVVSGDAIGSAQAAQ